MNDYTPKVIPIKEGDVITVDALEWICPWWEFDNPCVILRPVYQEFETHHADGAIESLMLDAVAAEWLMDDAPRWRWSPKYLRRVFNEALSGKEFPVARYEATRATFRIIRDEDGLMFEEIDEP